MKQYLNTLVIGGGGYIGNHLLSPLIATGRKVTVLGRQEVSSGNQLESVAYVRGDFSNHAFISDLLDQHEEVIHLSETYNIGSGIGLSNIDVIEAMSPLLSRIGCSPNIEYFAERPFDVKANVLDSKKLRKHTDWEPVVNFDEGLSSTYEWLTSYLE